MRHRLLLLLVLCAACQTDGFTALDPLVTFDGQVWAGGTLHLSSGAFAPPSFPLVLLGGDTLFTERVDSVTVQARVPDTSGTIDLSIGVVTVMHRRMGSSDPYSVVRLAVDSLHRRLGAVVIPETGNSSSFSLDLMP